MSDAPRDDDLVPVSVRLGDVVPPDDPEDWTRPLTWVVAVGMLAGPIGAAAWFLLAPPADADTAHPGTYVVAALMTIGATATGATQIGPVRAFAGTLGAGLFAALAVVILGVVTAGERQVGSASPTLAHAFAAAAGGLVGSVDASLVAIAFAHSRRWALRILPAAASGSVLAMIVVAILSA